MLLYSLASASLLAIHNILALKRSAIVNNVLI